MMRTPQTLLTLRTLRTLHTLRAAGIAGALLAVAPAWAQQPRGDLACKPTGRDFVYDCTIRLTRAGKPLEGVEISVGADMPAMPMAHNVKPVKAAPGKAPGEYTAKLDLEMLGLWAVKLRLAGPLRDQLVLNYEFTESGATPAKPGKPGKPGHGERGKH